MILERSELFYISKSCFIPNSEEKDFNIEEKAYAPGA
jgi:hypothetical protein